MEMFAKAVEKAMKTAFLMSQVHDALKEFDLDDLRNLVANADTDKSADERLNAMALLLGTREEVDADPDPHTALDVHEQTKMMLFFATEYQDLLKKQHERQKAKNDENQTPPAAPVSGYAV